MVTAGLAAVYGNYNISFMKAKMKEMMLAHNNQIMS